VPLPIDAPAAGRAATGNFEAELVVTARRTQADGVVDVELGLPDGDFLPVWASGAQVEVVLPGDTVRRYPLCGDPAERDRWHVGVGGCGGGRPLVDALAVGALVRVRGPRAAGA
jgi:ferredoxin-NADP reductase